MMEIVRVNEENMCDIIEFIENYLRDNLSVPDKREILTILQKY